jgi:uncharacterized protein
VIRSLTSSLLLALLLVLAALPAYAAEPSLNSGATPAAGSVPPAASVGRMLFIGQTLNNCGPSSVAEVLDYYGIHKTQGEVQAVLRADGNPGGMAPFGIPAYARGLGMSALMGAGGTDAVLKGLLASGFPVIVSQWVSLTDHYGHYRPIEAYDDNRGVFVSSDPYLGPNHAISYSEFDAIWASSNNRFYVIYPPDREPLLKDVLASTGWDPTSSLLADVAIQQARLDGGQTAGPAGWTFRKGYGAMSLAWDNLQLGELTAARSALEFAKAQGAAPILVRWIGDEIVLRTGN